MNVPESSDVTLVSPDTTLVQSLHTLVQTTDWAKSSDNTLPHFLNREKVSQKLLTSSSFPPIAHHYGRNKALSIQLSSGAYYTVATSIIGEWAAKLAADPTFLLGGEPAELTYLSYKMDLSGAIERYIFSLTLQGSKVTVTFFNTTHLVMVQGSTTILTASASPSSSPCLPTSSSSTSSRSLT